METTHTNEGKSGFFSITENEVVAGKMTYFLDENGKMAIDHTIVNPAFRGQGIGKILVDAGVEYARASQLKINAICSYAKALLEKSEAYKDVL
jgi:hypothetical protein